MKHNHNYEINYVEGKIIVTKSFLKEAGVIGSTAYTELAQVRKDYVRKWFLANYPHYREIPVLDADHRIIAPRLHLLHEASDKLEAVS